MTLKLHHHHPQFTLAAACSKTQVANQGKSGISFPALEILTFFFNKKPKKPGRGWEYSPMGRSKRKQKGNTDNWRLQKYKPRTNASKYLKHKKKRGRRKFHPPELQISSSYSISPRCSSCDMIFDTVETTTSWNFPTKDGCGSWRISRGGWIKPLSNHWKKKKGGGGEI